MARLWGMFNGEPFLKNPRLFVLNRRKKKVARRKRRLPPRGASGRFLKRRSNPPRKRRRAASRKRTTVTLRRATLRASNPRRRRTYRRNEPARRYKRRYRRNPFGLERFGLNTPTLTTMAYTSIGVIGTPVVEGFAAQVIPMPADPMFNKLARYAVKIGSAVAVGFLVRQIFGRDAGKAALVGGGAYILVDAIREFMPGMLPAGAPGAGYYFPTMGAQPLLGAYPDMGMSSVLTDTAPERLRPESRF